MNIVHIIPTYNEAENISKMIQVLIDIGKKYPRWQNYILVVDDHSPDGTFAIVKNIQKTNKNVHLLLKKKEGLGKALILGYKYAIETLKADIIVPNDADFQWDPFDFPRLVKKIEKGFDVAVASRHVPGGKVVGWNWFRKLNHDVSNSLLAWFVAGVHEAKDHAGNFKAIRVKDVLAKVPLEKMKNAGFSFQLQILYELSKVTQKFYEVPVVFRERKFGKSKIGFNRYYLRDVGEYIKNSIFIRLERNNNFVKYCFVGGFGFIFQSLIAKILINFKVDPGLSVGIGAESAIISNLMMNNSWTFQHKKIKNNKIFYKFLQFNGVSIGSIFIQALVVKIGTYFFGNSTWFIFMVLAIIFIVIPYSYFIYNKFIWRTKIVS